LLEAFGVQRIILGVQRMTIYYFSAPCGSGKTYQIIQKACQWANSGRRITIVQPTKELIGKTIEMLLKLGAKEANFLITPAIFDPNHPNREGSQRRGRNNIRYLRHIYLDFEDGELLPEQIGELFPQYRLVVFGNNAPADDRLPWETSRTAC
jgi:hypothetical protein